ncbi:FAD-dependent oxidoreductase [Actinocrispum wychmicini]|uniref:FAD/FMN-containing dehydrogenase n=1 Tax=Actinocrispum wychmicini TaxID=1213861 RepID=A0A4R2JZ27_9PSEU|nr:FAD-binding protein [Actinocrispum wychmicini]TCO59375.1 FAD/FMN-containing dehydrogenase [Actinocrispum wychmicini]
MRKTSGVNRRSVLFGAAAATGALTVGTTSAQAERAAVPVLAGATIRAGDPRYPELTTGNNQRFVARPDYVRMITSAEDAERAVRDVVRAGKRVSIRGGGHCFSDFVCNPEVEVILDVSEMTRVSYDPARRAFAVEAGARLINVYEALFKGWNVTIPGGICYSVGIAGHIAGGGYGLLSRAHGLTVDHLYAVEVVVVEDGGRVRTVVATREEGDPNRDLWWAHTGGGGGNFGMVTRYWFRSPGATGMNPSDQLISPPSKVLVSAIEFPWDQLDEGKFHQLLKNFGAWHERNAAPDSPARSLSSLFNVSSKAHGSLGMFTQVDAGAPGARKLLDDYLAAITEGVGITPRSAIRPMGEIGALPGFTAPRELPWLQATRMVGTNNPTITNPSSRGGHKSAYMLKNFSDAQIAAVYKHMTHPDFQNPDTMLVLFSFGGKVNAVSPHETANAQRGSVFKMCFQTFWEKPEDDPFYLDWLRELYGEFFAATGGVPVPGTSADGCYINYPDNDVANPSYNKSGVPWSTLYYKDNYPRLQRVKRRYDPTNYFRHKLSIQPA